MGLFWELFQEVQINNRKNTSASLEERIKTLESELSFVEDVLAKTLNKLEEVTGEDFSEVTEGISP